MSAFFDEIGLYGFANWTKVQAREEIDHGMILFDYIIERDGRVNLDKIDSPERNFENPLQVFESVYNTILDRRENPKEGSYTNYLFDKGIDKILKKVGEEATEIVIAAKNPNPEEIKYEISDFLYHAMVLMVERGVTWEDIINELADR